MENDLVKLNIGGCVFNTRLSTLRRFPNTKLGQLSPNSENYLSESKEYFFDRNPTYFNSVLDYYRSHAEQVHVPNYVCGSGLVQEFEFWDIPKETISDCCYAICSNFESADEVRKNMEKMQHRPRTRKDASTPMKKYVRSAWLFLDQPRSSCPAMVFFVLFMCMVVVSVIVTCLQPETTLRDTIGHTNTFNTPINTTTRNKSKPDTENNQDSELSWKLLLFGTTRPVYGLRVSEMLTDVYFTIELILHFSFCPNKMNFLEDANNRIDIFIFIITINSIIVLNIARNFMRNESFRKYFIVSNVASAFKLLRFFRLTKVYMEFRILLVAIRASMKELFLLTTCITFGIFLIIYGNLIYYVEIAEPDTFPNIFTGMWWAVITMTTVGYGDVVPKSIGGYIAGCITSMSGLLILAMPIAVISRNFDTYYNVHNNILSKARNKGNKSKKKDNSVLPSLEN